MIELQPPVKPAYDYPSLVYFVGVWRSVESSAPWMGVGFAPCAPVHKQAVSSRMWDASSYALDDELEKNTATLMGECIEKLEGVERALVLYGQCRVRCSWVEMMELERAQARYEAALLKLALLARREGVDV